MAQPTECVCTFCYGSKYIGGAKCHPCRGTGVYPWEGIANLNMAEVELKVMASCPTEERAAEERERFWAGGIYPGRAKK